MSRQLPSDCLNEIFELLEDKVTLHSCLLVNRLWCEVAVRILWRNIWYFNTETYPQILSTLVSCLPYESKNHLFKNGIYIMTPKPPSFNYASFCKVLSIDEIYHITKHVFERQPTINTSGNLSNIIDLVTRELLKMYANQIFYLKKLTYYTDYEIPNDIPFAEFPGARDCLTDLSELTCSSDVCPEFFYQLSQICHNIRSLNIQFGNTISDGLNDLISAQNNILNLSFVQFSHNATTWAGIVPSLTKHSYSLIKLCINELGGSERPFDTPLSFIARFINLRELSLSFHSDETFRDFALLQYVAFPRLQILKFPCRYPNIEHLIKFLEINGSYLREFHFDGNEDPLNLAIAQFCPNLKSLFTQFMDDEIETLKEIFDNCQQLERIEVWCGGKYLEEKELLEIIAQYSPDNFHELKIYNYISSQLLPKDFESFLISWKNRIPQNSFSFIISNVDRSLTKNNQNVKIIENYTRLGTIKVFIEE